jgi:hypothetical protein
MLSGPEIRGAYSFVPGDNFFVGELASRGKQYTDFQTSYN